MEFLISLVSDTPQLLFLPIAPKFLYWVLSILESRVKIVGLGLCLAAKEDRTITQLNF